MFEWTFSRPAASASALQMEVAALEGEFEMLRDVN